MPFKTDNRIKEFAALAQLPNLPHELRSIQVLVRFFLRMAILSAIVGAIRREPPFDAVLNHWDELMAYAALCSLVVGLIRTVPV